MEIEYAQIGDYLLPLLVLSDLAPDGLTPDTPPLGHYGMLHKSYLREHRPILYSQLLLTERLYPLCREVDEAAGTRMQSITDKEQAHAIILVELVHN